MSKFWACSRTPAADVWNPTFELYPYRRILACGNCFGRKSRNHNFPSDSQAFSA